uniref:CCHC-type domain-containing protein n=1 Tax=Meloidogyne javanica TaxID=6303 RepID=A0A915N182_MELJA
MNIDNEGMLLSNIGICVGVAKDGRFKLAHLVVLERPQCIFTCPWNLEEHFETGRWYRQVRVKDEYSAITKTYWKLIDDEFIPTILIRAGERFTLIEILDLPVDGFSDRNGNSPVPGTLYCVRVQISFTPGLIPIWTYNENYVGTLDSFHWTSAFMAENSISTDIFKSYRVDGLVIEKVVRKIKQRKILNFYLILQENAKEFPPRLAIAVGHDADKYGGGKSLDVGDWISFLPIMLDCYTYPVLFALHCPSSNTISNKKLKLFKEPGGDYKLTLKITEEYLAFIQAGDNSNNNNCRLPVLGLLVDPFNCSKNLLNKLGHLVTIEIRPQWHMEKGVVIWTALNSCENSKVPVLETKKCFRDTASVDNRGGSNNCRSRAALLSLEMGRRKQVPVGDPRNYGCQHCGGADHLVKDCAMALRCFKCHGLGHTSVNCTKRHPNSFLPGPPRCWNCGKPGHNDNACKETQWGRR